MSKEDYYWSLSALLLTTLDTVSTYLLLSKGYAYEANPLIASLLGLGLPVAMTIRWGVGVVLLLALAYHIPKVAWASRMLRVVTWVLGLVTCWHLIIWITYQMELT